MRKVSAEHKKAVRLRWHAKHRAKINAYNRAWIRSNRERRRASKRKSYLKHREKILAVNKAWAKRQRNKISYRLLRACRTRMWCALRGIGAKADSTLQLIGCSVQDLRTHLQEQFLPGMTWDNYGVWEIDHKVPCASFNFAIEDEQRRCFHFSNLQPLWGIDNRIKHATMCSVKEGK